MPIWNVLRELLGLPRLHPGLCTLEIVQPPDKYKILFTANETMGKNFTFTTKSKEGLGFREFEEGEVASCYGKPRSCLKNPNSPYGAFVCQKALIQFDSDKAPANIFLVVFWAIFCIFGMIMFNFVIYFIAAILLRDSNGTNARNRSPRPDHRQARQNPNLHERRVVLYDS